MLGLLGSLGVCSVCLGCAWGGRCKWRRKVKDLDHLQLLGFENSAINKVNKKHEVRGETVLLTTLILDLQEASAS